MRNIFIHFVLICFVISTAVEGQCGIKRSFGIANRVFGGDKLANVEFPWLVAMHHRKARSFFCAGSLITANHVLSGKI